MSKIGKCAKCKRDVEDPIFFMYTKGKRDYCEECFFDMKEKEPIYKEIRIGLIFGVLLGFLMGIFVLLPWVIL